MIAIGNWTDADQVINLDIDWEKLQMNQSAVKIEIPDIDNLQTAGTANVKHLSIPASKGLILIISR